MYDLIGDIHGHAAPLKALLKKLGYQQREGIWQHASRKVIFVGDFIDRGPEQVEVVRIARAMVESGNALAVMGNHEFNAVAWTLPDAEQPGEFLRPHSERNLKQHREFLDQVVEGSALHLSIIDWFRTLPLFLDLPGLRVVHACWHEQSIEQLRPCLDGNNVLHDDAWPLVARKGAEGFDALEVVLKGMEAPLPDDVWFHDKDGHVRRHTRLRWWWSLRGETPVTWRDLAMLPSSEIDKLPHQPVPDDLIPGYHDAKPVFVGHYWMRGAPRRLSEKVACLDYSIAAKNPDKLVAYRWDGEREIADAKFVWV